MVQYSFMTTVMDPRHLVILDDWLAFLDVAPRSLFVAVGKASETRKAVENFAAERGLDLKITAEVEFADLQSGDRRRRIDQFQTVGEGLCLHVALDVFPFRNGHTDWLAVVVQAMAETSAFFFTCSTKRYRADIDTKFPRLCKTQRVSDGMLLVDASKWLGIQQDLEGEADKRGRFASEGLVELYCRQSGEYGLRRLNDHEWRVFHAHVWDERADTVRAAFRKGGKGLEPFMNGYQDDDFHPWDKYFMHPRPSAIKRARIELGRIRRDVARKLFS